jgi:hypothetical protein
MKGGLFLWSFWQADSEMDGFATPIMLIFSHAENLQQVQIDPRVGDRVTSSYRPEWTTIRSAVCSTLTNKLILGTLPVVTFMGQIEIEKISLAM